MQYTNRLTDWTLTALREFEAELLADPNVEALSDLLEAVADAIDQKL